MFEGLIRLVVCFIKDQLWSPFLETNSSSFISKSAFTCNRDEISSPSRPGMKKFLLTREFHHRMKRVEFHPRMKFNLKENLPLSMTKTYNKISHFSQLLKSEA